MAQLFANNATSTLAADITDTATSLTVGTGAGAEFPNPTAPDYFLVTLESATDVEIVKVTARSGDVMTLVRAQEGTVAAAFATDDLVELRVTAATMTTAMVAPAQIYAGAMREIATVTTTGSQATVVFSGIAGTYRDLMLTIDGRSTGAVNSSRVRMQFNGDTAANYSYTVENRFAWDNTLAGTYIEVGSVPGATTGANYRATTNAWVRNYASAAAFRSTISQSSIIDATTVVHVQSAGWWENTANGITQITLSLAFGNWVDGSVVSLYGIGGEVGGASLNPIYTKYDPFCPPSAPSSLDDEFIVDGSGTPAGWTAVGATPTLVARKGALVWTAPLSASFNTQIIEKALPAGAFTVTTRVTIRGAYRFANSGLIIRNNSTGRSFRLSMFIDGASDTTQSFVTYRAFATRWSAINTRDSFVIYPVDGTRSLFLFLDYDGTTLRWMMSEDGVEFVLLGSETMSSHFTGGNLPDRVGLVAHSENATNAPTATFDFFRYFPTFNADIGRNIGVGSDGAIVESLPLILHNQVI